MRIAVVGDVHTQFDLADAALLDARGLDLVLFVGDLPDRLHRATFDVAARIAHLRTPTIVFPGNHDGTTPFGVLSEGLGLLRHRYDAGHRGAERVDRLRRALGPAILAGYSLHPFPEHGLTVIGARPHAMDGRSVSFDQLLGERFGVRDLWESALRLRALVDRAEGDLVFLAHNGPRGLGAHRGAPFASKLGEDWGDPDLADAVHHARSRGRRVLAVLAGHLHHRGDRDWCVVRDGTTYVNAARVPRHERVGGELVRHHVELAITGGEVAVTAVRLVAGQPEGADGAAKR